MALQWMWLGMAGGSLLYAALCGRGPQMLASALEAAGGAIALTVSLGAGYLLFCGWINILRELGAAAGAWRADAGRAPGGDASGGVHEPVDEHAGAWKRGDAAGDGSHATDGGRAAQKAGGPA